MYSPPEEMKRGSDSVTYGKRLMLARYITCENMARRVRLSGKPSTRQRRVRVMMTKYTSRVRNRFAMTVCSSTSSER
jgi:hypothetical protein